MKRWAAVAGFVMFLALCASAAYWVMQAIKPPVRPVAAPPQTAPQAVNLDAAAALFGGRKTSVEAAPSNYVLKGVVVAANPRDSVAIVAVDGKPAQAIALNAEVVRGVSVKEVTPQYAILSEGGVSKKIPLQEKAAPSAAPNAAGPAPGQAPAPVPVPVPPPSAIQTPAPALAPVPAPAARPIAPLQISPAVAPTSGDLGTPVRTGRSRRPHNSED